MRTMVIDEGMNDEDDSKLDFIFIFHSCLLGVVLWDWELLERMRVIPLLAGRSVSAYLSVFIFTK